MCKKNSKVFWESLKKNKRTSVSRKNCYTSVSRKSCWLREYNSISRNFVVYNFQFVLYLNIIQFQYNTISRIAQKEETYKGVKKELLCTSVVKIHVRKVWVLKGLFKKKKSTSVSRIVRKEEKYKCVKNCSKRIQGHVYQELLKKTIDIEKKTFDVMYYEII